MDQRTDDLLLFGEALREARRPFEVASQFFADRGIGGFMYAYAPTRRALDMGGMTQGFQVYHTYPQEWEREIGIEALLDNEVTTEAVVNGATEFAWDENVFRGMVDRLTPEQRHQLEFEQDIGMRFGMTLSLDDGPLGFSGVGLWAKDARNLGSFQRDWLASREILRVASQMLDTVIREERPNEVVGLTPREREVCQWVAFGLRGDQIADRMRISDRTLEKHVTNAKAKLKARTRDQMVARAILMGLLDI